MASVYVHIDTVSNHVLSSIMNLSSESFLKGSMPGCILLLSGRSDLAIYDDYTGFYFIRGESKIREFLNANERAIRPCNWIDFESVDFLHQLSPQEIADLLYISHAKTHLHSPFFYKLQNEYIYLRLSQDFTKVYFRRLDDFYEMLSDKLTNEMSGVITLKQKRLFFTKQHQATAISVELIKELAPYLKMGILFAFHDYRGSKDHYQIPLYNIADDYYHSLETHVKPERLVGFLQYHEGDGWSYVPIAQQQLIV